MKTVLFGFLAVLVLICSIPVSAKEHTEAQFGEAVIGEWNFAVLAGYAAIENPLNKRDTIDTYILPTWSYYGENLYIDNMSVGYSLIESETLLFDISGYLNEDGALFNLDHANLSFLDITNYVPRVSIRPSANPIVFEEIERDFSYMAGFSLQWPNDYIQARLTLAKDISQGHNGEEITFSLFNYYQIGDLKFHWQLGAIRKSKTLVEYYYQFTEDELGGNPSPYQFDDAINTFAQIALNYQITNHLSLVFSIKRTWLDEQLLETPLVDKGQYLKGVTGINYKF